MGAGFGAPPAAPAASFSAPVSGGLDDLFDLGGGVGMPMGAYSPPKTVSSYSRIEIHWLHNYGALTIHHFVHRFGCQP